MWEHLSVTEVIEIHDAVITPGELQGLAGDKSLEGALSRVDFRVQYGLIKDVFDLAASYAQAISQGHVFNDANKRTAYLCMHTILNINNTPMVFTGTEIGDLIIKLAQGLMSEVEFADWLRRKRIAELEKEVAK